jgi:hypothetical protein
MEGGKSNAPSQAPTLDFLEFVHHPGVWRLVSDQNTSPRWNIDLDRSAGLDLEVQTSRSRGGRTGSRSGELATWEGLIGRGRWLGNIDGRRGLQQPLQVVLIVRLIREVMLSIW